MKSTEHPVWLSSLIHASGNWVRDYGLRLINHYSRPGPIHFGDLPVSPIEVLVNTFTAHAESISLVNAFLCNLKVNGPSLTSMSYIGVSARYGGVHAYSYCVKLFALFLVSEPSQL